MEKHLHILILEDSPLDAELMQHELKREGFHVEAVRVETAAAFVAALSSTRPDAILADYALPAYDGLAALAVAQKMCPEVPFILVSGALGEEVAVDAMRRGVSDYVLKQRLGRLGPAVRRAIDAAEEKRRRFRAEDAQRESERKARAILDFSYEFIALLDVNGIVLDVNRTALEFVGIARDDVIGKVFWDTAWWRDVPEARRKLREAFDAALATGTVATFVSEHVDTAGRKRMCESTIKPVKDASGKVVLLIPEGRDITERQQIEEMLEFTSQGGWTGSSDEFLGKLMRRVCSVLGMEYALVAEVLPGKPRLRTTAMCAHDGMVATTEYDLEGTPCANVFGKAMCLYEQDVQQLFPHDRELVQLGVESYVGMPLWDQDNKPVGVFAVMGTKPVTVPRHVEAMMRAAVPRVSSELVRRRAEAERAIRVQRLEDLVEQRTQQIHDRQKRLVVAMDAAGLGMWDWNIDDDTWQFDDRFCEITGIPLDATLPHAGTVDADVPDVQRSLLDKIRQIARITSGQISAEFTIQHAARGRIWLSLIAVVLDANHDGTAIRIAGYIQDITYRKQAEERLRASEQRYRTLFEQSPVGVMIWKGGAVTDCNKTGTSILGIPPSSVTTLAETIREWQFLRADMTELPFSELPSSIAEAGRQVANMVVGVRKGDSQLIWLNCSTAPVVGGEGTFMLVFDDITVKRRNEERLQQQRLQLEDTISDLRATERDLIAAKEQAEQANRAKSTFLANMSHEIRTPLNAILGYAQLMQRDESVSPRHRDWLDAIDRSGRHLLMLLNGILEMSKIEAGHARFSPAPFDCEALIQDIAAMFRIRAREKGLAFDIAMAADLPQFIVADEPKIRQILVNLLGNAMKFTDKGGINVRIACQPCANPPPPLQDAVLFRFDVEDTGCGIPGCDVERVFDAFEQSGQQLHATEGSGLGLAISRWYARIMGGDLHVTSEVGKGSTFVCTCAARQCSQTDVPLTSSSHAARVVGLAPGQAAPRTLVVDDDAESRNVLRLLLQSFGATVHQAADGNEAVAAAVAWKPDIIFLDRRMPGMDGLETLRALRAQVTDARPPVVMVTAGVFDEDRLDALAAGADGFVHKPFRDADVIEEIVCLLDLKVVRDKEEIVAPRGEAGVVPKTNVALPTQLVADIREAVEAGNAARVRELLATRVAAADARFAKALQALADKYDYEAIVKAIG